MATFMLKIRNFRYRGNSCRSEPLMPPTPTLSATIHIVRDRLMDIWHCRDNSSSLVHYCIAVQSAKIDAWRQELHV